MHFHENFKKIQKGPSFLVKNLEIIKVCDVVELPKKIRNPL